MVLLEHNSPDPLKAVIDILDDVVVKTHKDRDRFTNELVGYAQCHWAAPRLVRVDVANMVLVIEKCKPMTQVSKKRAHAIQARKLLEDLHSSGWNHRDCAVENMVLHKTRGVLLIDWETAWCVPDTEAPSCDLYGALAAGFDQESIPIKQRPNGVWWGSGRETDPGVWWESVLE